MKRTYSFKSVPMIPDTSGETKAISYDMGGVRDHAAAFSLSGFLLCPSWITNFFLAFLAVALVSALVFGFLLIGLKVDMSGGSARAAFIAGAVILFLLLWFFIGAPAAIRRLKWDHVVKERGTGSWKIVDDADWERFCRMRRLEQDRLKKEEEYRKAGR